MRNRSIFLHFKYADKISSGISKIAGKYKKLECVECADDIMNFMKRNKIEGQVVDFNVSSLTKDKFSNIYSDFLNMNISENGYHKAVLYNNKIYDNIHSEGIDLKSWLSELYCSYAPNRSLYQLYVDGELIINFNNIF